MGLYIPGTSIRGCGVGGPIGCGCPCYNWYNGRCQVVNKDVGDPTVLGFPDFCPIVHVQSPHGRLTDADAFESIKYELPDGQKAFNRGFHSGVQYVQRLIMDAPTIIEGEDV